jgi:hypothetical protein
MLYLHYAPLTFHKLTIFETNLREHVAHSCCKQNKCIIETNDAHAYEMQVQLWEPNTWGVTAKVYSILVMVLSVADDGLKTFTLGDCAKKCQQAFLVPLPRRAWVKRI